MERGEIRRVCEVDRRASGEVEDAARRVQCIARTSEASEDGTECNDAGCGAVATFVANRRSAFGFILAGKATADPSTSRRTRRFAQDDKPKLTGRLFSGHILPLHSLCDHRS